MFSKIKYPNLTRLVDDKLALLNEKSLEQIKKIQLIKFNHQWHSFYSNYKFYKNLKEKYNLPNFIEKLDEIKKFPKMDKSFLNKNAEDIVKDFRNPKFTLTGGTSGEVTKFLTSYINEEQNYVNKVVCNKLHNGSSKDKVLYIWGHSHKLGKSAINRKIKTFINSFKDFYQNRTRVSAYDLSNKNLKKIFEKIKNNNYDVIFSYASTFEILASYLRANNFSYNKKIKIIFTSENLSENTYNKLKEIFPKSNIIGEYGMAETGIIAYAIDNYKSYKVIWTDFIIQSVNSEIVITEIANKTFPLINYYPDDSFVENVQDSNSLLNIPEISGKIRPNFEIIFDNDEKEYFSLIYFDHILKNVNSVFSAQYYLQKENLYIFFTGEINEENLRLIILNYFKKKIKNIRFKKITTPVKTISGKFKYLLDEKDFNNF